MAKPEQTNYVLQESGLRPVIGELKTMLEQAIYLKMTFAKDSLHNLYQLNKIWRIRCCCPTRLQVNFEVCHNSWTKILIQSIVIIDRLYLEQDILQEILGAKTLTSCSLSLSGFHFSSNFSQTWDSYCHLYLPSRYPRKSLSRFKTRLFHEGVCIPWLFLPCV